MGGWQRRVRVQLHRWIAETHPRLGQYRARTIKTGNICVYTSYSHQPVTWEF